jgi:hypothetical protein
VLLASLPLAYLYIAERRLNQEAAELRETVRKQADTAKLAAQKRNEEARRLRNEESASYKEYSALRDRHQAFQDFITGVEHGLTSVPMFQQAINSHPPLASSEYISDSVDKWSRGLPRRHELAYAGSDLEQACSSQFIGPFIAITVHLKIAADNRAWNRSYQQQFDIVNARVSEVKQRLRECKTELDAMNFRLRGAESELRRVGASPPR